jgi:hypothetical protein
MKQELFVTWLNSQFSKYCFTVPELPAETESKTTNKKEITNEDINRKH